MKRKIVRCSDVLDHICEELDTKLSSAQCREIKRHLQKCPNCAAYLDSMRKTIKLYTSYSNPHVPRQARKQLFAILKLKS
jgi:anti-sigma factor RsiW